MENEDIKITRVPVYGDFRFLDDKRQVLPIKLVSKEDLVKALEECNKRNGYGAD